jgi:hypothetical protein
MSSQTLEMARHLEMPTPKKETVHLHLEVSREFRNLIKGEADKKGLTINALCINILAEEFWQ